MTTTLLDLDAARELAAAVYGSPQQARVPKGNRNGGEWMDTPGALLTDAEGISPGGGGGKGWSVGADPETVRQDFADTWQKSLEGTGLTVGKTYWAPDDSGGGRYMTVGGFFVDGDGRKAGSINRIVDLENSTVDHDFLKINPEWQGGGVGSQLLADSEDLYRSQGIKEITVHANIDVGGYTWARLGFEFQSPSGAVDVLDRVYDQARKKGATLDQLTKINDWRKSAINADVGEKGAKVPLPADIAHLGWSPGAKTWLGKELMLGEDWHGVKHL
jgi:GNAT superfamily N-acetyltransferase